MKKITLIGLDLAKSVFQVHGVDAEGNAVLRKRLTHVALAEWGVGFGKLCSQPIPLRETQIKGSL